MRALALVLVPLGFACGPPPVTPQRPTAPPVIVVSSDRFVREEPDGGVSVAVRVALGDDVAFGMVRVARATPATALAASELVVARARAWQDLSRRLATHPALGLEAAAHGLALLTPCPGETSDATRRSSTADNPIGSSLALHVDQARLVARLGCAATDGSGANVVIDGDLSIRRDARVGVSVLAIATLGDQHAVGWARSAESAIERVPTSNAAYLARGRAWRALVTMVADDPARAFQAAERGLDAMVCQANHWRDSYLAAVRERGPRPAEAARLVTELLDASLLQCAWKYRDEVR